MEKLKKEQIDYFIENYAKKDLKEIAIDLNINYQKLLFLPKKFNLKKPKEILSRKCPNCDKTIICSNKSNLRKAINLNCFECANKIKSEKYIGEKNPFFGKRHDEKFKKKLSLERKGKHFSKKTEFKKGDNSGNKNIMCKKNFLQIWTEKYGKEEAKKRLNDFVEKQKLNSSGSKNNMYGKPSPQGSGNGWSGWYKGWFFRSINELSYMINVIERFNIKWENGESKRYKIEYLDWENKKRNYFPDFILENKYMVECKPKKLWNTPSVLAKRKYAEIFCNKNGLKYKIVNCKKLNIEEIKCLYNNGKIKFTKKYEKKFKKYILKNEE